MNSRKKTMSILMSMLILAMIGCDQIPDPVTSHNTSEQEKNTTSLARSISRFELNAVIPEEVIEAIPLYVPDDLKNTYYDAAVRKYKNSNEYQIIYTKGRIIVTSNVNGRVQKTTSNIKADERIKLHKVILRLEIKKDHKSIVGLRKITYDAPIVGVNFIEPLAEYAQYVDPYPDEYRNAGTFYTDHSYGGSTYTWQYYFTGPATHFMQNGNLQNNYFNDCTSSIKLFLANSYLNEFKFHRNSGLSGDWSRWTDGYGLSWIDIGNLYTHTWMSNPLDDPNDEISSFRLSINVSQ